MHSHELLSRFIVFLLETLLESRSWKFKWRKVHPTIRSNKCHAMLELPTSEIHLLAERMLHAKNEYCRARRMLNELFFSSIKFIFSFNDWATASFARKSTKREFISATRHVWGWKKRAEFNTSPTYQLRVASRQCASWSHRRAINSTLLFASVVSFVISLFALLNTF